MHPARDKPSHAFARHPVSASIGSFPSQSPRDPLNGSARAYQPELARHYFVHNYAIKSLEDLGCLQMAKRHFHNRKVWFRLMDRLCSGLKSLLSLARVPRLPASLSYRAIAESW